LAQESSIAGTGQKSAAGETSAIYVNSAHAATNQTTTNFSPWTGLMGKYLDPNGNVRYREWINDPSDRKMLADLLSSIALQDLSALKSSQAKLAFWINTYNALAIEVRLRETAHEIPRSFNVWKCVFVFVGETPYSLDAIEHEQLRPMLEPRIHFALHCGAKSCPVLKPKAWDLRDLDQSLDQAAKDFMSTPQAAQWDEANQTLRLSKIFEWYRSDFGSSDEELIRFIMPNLNSEIQRSLSDRVVGSFAISFLEYNWSLADAGPATESTGQEFHTRSSDQIPREIEYWIGQSEQYDLGLVEADRLRQKLLSPIETPATSSPNGTNTKTRYCDRIAQVIAAFQKQMADRQGLNDPVSSFSVTSSRLEEQLQGHTQMETKGVFAAFDGRWFGLWDVHPVNHDWRPSRVHSPPNLIQDPSILVLADQYAWIHNGFGWNYLVQSRSAGSHPYVLGQVYYLNANNLKQIESRKPHVGFADYTGNDSSRVDRLVWITEQEIFLEEVFRQPTPEDNYYVITGIYHRLFELLPTVSPSAVQAKYTRNSQSRPPFTHLKWDPPAAYSSYIKPR